MRKRLQSKANIKGLIPHLLVGAALVISAVPAKAADMSAVPVVVADDGWWSEGEAEVGTNIFIDEPPSGYKYSVSKGDFLQADEIDSRAKLFEYGEYPDVFSYLHFRGGKVDGSFYYDFLAEDIGYDSQHYSLDLQKTGRHYLTLDWDEIPHQLTTSAKTVFEGMGSTNLTVNPALRTTLDPLVGNLGGAANQANRDMAKAAINANASKVEMDIQRDKGTVDYTFTSKGKWSATVNYTNEKRDGMQPFALNWAQGGGRPTNILEVAEPLDDRTQNLTLGAQRVGSTKWGAWVEQFQYYRSWYDNDLTALNVQNPWCDPGLAGGCSPVDNLRLGLLPSNDAYSFTNNGAMDLPWNSRWTRTIQYTKMEQDDPFVDVQTINGLFQPALPAYSANAEIETLLFNNTLTSRLTNTLTSTLKYRYYDVDNNTPELIWPDYYLANGPRLGDEKRNLAMDYTKQNASAALNKRIGNRTNIGSSFGWEQYDRFRRDANVTNEYTGKIYGDSRIGEGTIARGSVAYSERRYDRYDEVAFVEHVGLTSAENWPSMRKFDMANRNRWKVEGFLDVPVTNTLVITPTAGLDYNDYPVDDVNLQLGVEERNGWNVGFDIMKRFGPRIDITAGYNYENWDMHMDDCCGNGGYPLTPGNVWTADVTQHFHFVHAGVNLQVIPDRLKLKFNYHLAFSNEENELAPCSSGLSGCRGGEPFPDERNLFQRFKVEAELTDKPRGGYSLKDEPTPKGHRKFFKVGYIFEKNDTENWAYDDMEPYIGEGTVQSANLLTGGDTSIFLAAYNPNYTAHIVYGSIGVRW